MKNLRRLFVDPASVSSGWALFEGNKFVASGTVLADKKKKIDKRLLEVYTIYDALDFGKLDEVHLEDVPRSRTCHIYVHYSIGVILAALGAKAPVQKVDIPVKAWQKFVDWTGEQEPLEAFRGRTQSEDEKAAISMGLWYLENEV